LSNCKGPGALTGNTSNYQKEFEQGNYATAFLAYKQLVKKYENKGKNAPDSLYVRAGISALHIDSLSYAKKYLEKVAYKDEVSADVLSATSKMYRKIDNLSKEIRFLEWYQSNYPDGAEHKELKFRLFDTYVESENVEGGLKLWNVFSAIEKQEVQLQEAYLKLNNFSGNSSEANKVGREILKSDSKNIVALEYFANRYYRKAEDLYVSEMTAYKENRTNKQYTRLLSALKTATSDFKKSRDYYQQLFEMTKKSNYAKRLSKIYSRLDNEQKANYYKGFI